MVDEQSLPVYDSRENELTWNSGDISQLATDVLRRIGGAKSPVILAGTGIRLADAMTEFQQLIRSLQIPVTTAWTHDLISSDDPLFCGRPGTIGERAGNFTVQNADLVLVLGSRLNIRQVSYNWKSFAPHAYKIQVDVDAAEFNKPIVRPDLAVHCDLKIFLRELNRQASRGSSSGKHSHWLSWCRERVARYPVVQEHQRQPGPPLNPYYFMELLAGSLGPDDVVVCGNATACIVSFQALALRSGQRLFSNSGSASMGYDLPAAIGAAVATGKRVICLAGDGSIQMNLQELQTIVQNQLPVKIMVLSNNGYLSIRSTQTNFFGRLVGESKASGVSFPDMILIADAYGIPRFNLSKADEMGTVRGLLEQSGPLVVNVVLDPAQAFEPRLRSKQLEDGTIVTPSLEDMFQFLSAEELESNRYGAIQQKVIEL
jgi:acetolactate synthase-1/2/3 large subunit